MRWHVTPRSARRVHPRGRTARAAAGAEHADMTLMRPRPMRPRPMRPRRVRSISMAILALAGLALVLTLVSCAQTPRARTCEEFDGVRSAVQDTRNVNLSENGMVALDSALAHVKTELQMLRADLSADLRPHTDAVAASVDKLRNSVSEARANPTSTAFAAVNTGLQQLRITVNDLRTAVSQIC
jgi:hypothetical protein